MHQPLVVEEKRQVLLARTGHDAETGLLDVSDDLALLVALCHTILTDNQQVVLVDDVYPHRVRHLVDVDDLGFLGVFWDDYQMTRSADGIDGLGVIVNQ